MSLRCAFVGLGYHLKYTKSSQFFIDFLTEEFGPLEVFADDWQWARLPSKKAWDLVVFWQHLPERELLDAVNIKHPVLVPMFDDCPHDQASWEPYRDCSMVCFSSTLAELLEGWGHRVARVRYAPAVPERQADWSQGPQRAFFWPRTRSLGWTVARAVLTGHRWQTVHLHVTEDRYFDAEPLTEHDQREWGVVRTRWFSRPGEYTEALARCQVFLAPRRTEGIGMSFLEAMALGLAVLAPDGATMNEYIESGTDGYLYDPEQPQPPDWTKVEAWGRQARLTMMAAREAYLATLPALASFLVDPSAERRAPVAANRRTQSRHRSALVRYLLFQATWPVRKLKNWMEAR